VHGVLHGHRYGNGTKMWTWGQNKLTDWTQTLRDDGLGSGWGGCFTEQQTGVMPTQDQRFMLDAGAAREWSEYFKGMEGVPPADAPRLYSANYTDAIDAATRWLDSPAGVNESTFAEVDGWLASHSADPIGGADVLFAGQPLASSNPRAPSLRLAHPSSARVAGCRGAGSRRRPARRCRRRSPLAAPRRRSPRRRRGGSC
jgi:hypothetical protein